MKKSPVIVIGIDGADPILMRKWVKQGYLPTIGKISDQGSGICDLASSPNSMSPSAWTTFRTGLCPGQHGIFYFIDKIPGQHKLQHSVEKVQEFESFWKNAGEHGNKVAALYLPLSYPAEKINGIQVSGWLTPSLGSPGFTYPASLAEKITRFMSEYKIHRPFKELINIKKYELALESKIRSIKDKQRLAHFLLKDEDWDLVLVGFEEVDQLQHFFWHFMDQNHPKHDKDAKENLKYAILKGYMAVDEAISTLRERFGKNARYIIFSDHGFRANTYGPLYIKDLLVKTGYQVQKRSFLGGLSRQAYGMAELLPTGVKHFLDHLLPKTREHVLEKKCFGDIKWSRTKAYTIYLNRTSEIWINLDGRDEKGIVPRTDYDKICDELTDLLLQCEEKTSGEKPICNILKKETAYKGSKAGFAPDLTLKWRKNVFVNGLTLKTKHGKIVADHCIENDIRTGDHADYGVFVDNSVDDLQESVRKRNIADLSQHILSALDVPVIWGKQKIEGEISKKTKSETAFLKHPQNNNKLDYSKERKKQIEERLKSLGYL